MNVLGLREGSTDHCIEDSVVIEKILNPLGAKATEARPAPGEGAKALEFVLR
jgi:hypothetical protein